MTTLAVNQLEAVQINSISLAKNIKFLISYW